MGRVLIDTLDGYVVDVGKAPETRPPDTLEFRPSGPDRWDVYRNGRLEAAAITDREKEARTRDLQARGYSLSPPESGSG